MAVKCTECGAAIKDDSKFCNYCGAKLPDPTKRIEVNVNKRIEDVAEMKRADYEEQESLLRQKQMKRDLRKGKVKWIACGIVALLCAIGFIIPNGHVKLLSAGVLICLIIYIVVSWIDKR